MSEKGVDAGGDIKTTKPKKPASQPVLEILPAAIMIKKKLHAAALMIKWTLPASSD
jgi:hypothetical protein